MIISITTCKPGSHVLMGPFMNDVTLRGSSEICNESLKLGNKLLQEKKQLENWSAKATSFMDASVLVSQDFQMLACPWKTRKRKENDTHAVKGNSVIDYTCGSVLPNFHRATIQFTSDTDRVRSAVSVGTRVQINLNFCGYRLQSVVKIAGVFDIVAKHSMINFFSLSRLYR